MWKFDEVYSGRDWDVNSNSTAIPCGPALVGNLPASRGLQNKNSPDAFASGETPILRGANRRDLDQSLGAHCRHGVGEGFDGLVYVALVVDA